MARPNKVTCDFCGINFDTREDFETHACKLTDIHNNGLLTAVVQEEKWSNGEEESKMNVGALVSHAEDWKPDPAQPEVPADRLSAITQAIGTASVCWTLTPRGIFDSERARAVAEGLYGYLAKIDKPNLGLATTEELIKELAARARLGGYADYRTVDQNG